MLNLEEIKNKYVDIFDDYLTAIINLKVDMLKDVSDLDLKLTQYGKQRFDNENAYEYDVETLKMRESVNGLSNLFKDINDAIGRLQRIK